MVALQVGGGGKRGNERWKFEISGRLVILMCPTWQLLRWALVDKVIGLDQSPSSLKFGGEFSWLAIPALHIWISLHL